MQQADRRTGGMLSANPPQALALAGLPFRQQTSEQADRLAAVAAENGLRAQMLAMGGGAQNSSSAPVTSVPQNILDVALQQSTSNHTASARRTVNSLRDEVLAIVESSSADPELKRVKVGDINLAASMIRERIVNPNDPHHQRSVNVVQGASIDLASSSANSDSAKVGIWNDAIADTLGSQQPSTITPGKWARK